MGADILHDDVVAERSPPTGMTMAAFIVTGLVPYQLFREASSRVLVAISSNRGLLFYPQVRPLDLISARLLLEVATGFSIFALLVGADAIYQGTLRIDDLLRVFAGIGLCGVIGGALGMVLSSLSLYMPSVQNLAGVILRPMFWLSGVFYTANDVPQGPTQYHSLQSNPSLRRAGARWLVPRLFDTGRQLPVSLRGVSRPHFDGTDVSSAGRGHGLS